VSKTLIAKAKRLRYSVSFFAPARCLGS
jgi:hypothetical protein